MGTVRDIEIDHEKVFKFNGIRKEELEPYFDLWRSVAFSNGSLAVVAVEHDRTSRRVKRIAKGTDGRALV